MSPTNIVFSEQFQIDDVNLKYRGIIGWLISGHCIHHFNVIKARYLEIV